VDIRHRKLHLPLVFPMHEILYCKHSAFVHIARTADNWPSSASRHNWPSSAPRHNWPSSASRHNWPSSASRHNWPSSASKHNVHLLCLLILTEMFISRKRHSCACALHHEVMWTVEVQFHVFLISSLNGGKGLASQPNSKR